MTTETQPPDPAQPKLEDIEQYRMQMAGISTAAIGYWKEGDSIHPDYDTVALRDVARLYAKYDALYRAAAIPAPEGADWTDVRMELEASGRADLSAWVASKLAAPAPQAPVALTDERIAEAARSAHIAFALGKHRTYEHALTRAVERAHGIPAPKETKA